MPRETHANVLAKHFMEVSDKVLSSRGRLVAGCCHSFWVPEVSPKVDFTVDCSEKLKTSFGYETYPAKWKRPNQELTVLLPFFGEINTYFTCNLEIDVKDFAFFAHDGRMSSEPSANSRHGWSSATSTRRQKHARQP
jgi:hypothetical protein